MLASKSYFNKMTSTLLQKDWKNPGYFKKLVNLLQILTYFKRIRDPNPFLVPASYPLPFGSSHLSSPNSPPTPALRRDIQWHQKMGPTCSVRPLALRDETYKTSATDAAGLPNNPGCPHSSSRRKGAKRKGRPLCPMHIDSEDDSGGLRRD